MKITIAFATSCLFILLWLRGVTPAPEPYRPLPPGRTNASLLRVGDLSTLEIGARLYYSTRTTPFAKVLDFKERHLFPDGRVSAAALIQMPRETPIWKTKHTLARFWTDARGNSIRESAK